MQWFFRFLEGEMQAQEQPVVVANFPITPDVSLRKFGTHNDMTYEIVNHSRSKADYFSGKFETVSSDGTWCYYVIVTERMLPPELFSEFWLEPSGVMTLGGCPSPTYDYCSAPFADADWHGGVTFYEKRGGVDGIARSVKIGCDFGHYWDQGRMFDLAGVTFEAIRTIDKLRDMYQFYSRCPWNGAWQTVTDMVEHEGKLYSRNGLDSLLAFRAEHAANKEPA